MKNNFRFFSYPKMKINIFLITPAKHMLWVLNGSNYLTEMLLLSTHNKYFHGNIMKLPA